ncbi:MAG TPA: hypothetical protein DEP07_02845 [Brevibacillus sp.]|nr:hypothetical protein [Brevibacillus sp.]
MLFRKNIAAFFGHKKDCQAIWQPLSSVFYLCTFCMKLLSLVLFVQLLLEKPSGPLLIDPLNPKVYFYDEKEAHIQKLFSRVKGRGALHFPERMFS